MLTKTKTSSWWRWAEEVFRRVGANDVARVLPTKNWRDDQALKIPPIGNRNGMMIFDYDERQQQRGGGERRGTVEESGGRSRGDDEWPTTPTPTTASAGAGCGAFTAFTVAF